MGKITYTVQRVSPHHGVAVKDGIRYDMRELRYRWKLVTESGIAKIEFAWSKKDLPEFTDWCEYLVSEGYEILLAV